MKADKSFVPIKEEKILISIIMPTFNHAQYVGRAIESVLEQTIKNWELIIIDNNSTDKTANVLNVYKDERIKIYQIKNHGSIGKSRNLGIHNSTGEWIAFLDSDDWWKAEKLESSLQFLKDYDLIYHPLKVIRNDLDEAKSSSEHVGNRKLTSPILKDLIIKGNPIANSSVLVRKSLLTSVGMVDTSEALNPICDYHTWLKIAFESDRFFFLNRSLGYYRLHQTNVSKSKRYVSHLPAFSPFFSVLTKKEKYKVLQRDLYYEAKWLYCQSEYNNARKLFFKIVRNSIWSFKFKSLFFFLVLQLKRFTF